MPECIDPITRVQVRNTLVSWYNKRNEEVAQMEGEGNVSADWIERYKIVLKAVEKEVERIDDLPECPLEGE